MVSNITPTAVGQQNLTGSKEQLFLKMYAGKVLSTFETATKMEGMVDVQTISSGKSFTFPVVGRAEAKYHLRGDNMLDPANGYLNEVEMSEKVIYLDRPLVSARTTDDWDDLVNHWEAASRLATEQGNALGRKRDQQLLQLLHLASVTDPALTNQPSDTDVSQGGTISAAWSFASKAAAEVSIQSIGTAAARLASRNVPMNEIYCAMNPTDYYATLTAPDSPFIAYETNKTGPNGNISDGETAINRVAGFKIFVSNHMPTTAKGEDLGTFNTYGDGASAADFTDIGALCFHKSCIGSLRRQGLTVARQRKEEIIGDLITAYFIEGHGVLRPEAAVTILRA